MAWDQFAQGDNSLGTRLNRERELFERHLTDALATGDPRAPGRVVFYAVVQVGGFIPVTSPLGEAFQKRVGDAVPIFHNPENGLRSFFAGDLYFWWEGQKNGYTPFPLYEEWRQRDFARTVAIRLYENTAKKRE